MGVTLLCMLRLTCIDVDGTLVGSSNEVLPQVWAAAERAVAAGMHLSELLCRSGRGAAAQEQLARALRGVVEEAAPPLVAAAFSLLRSLQSGERSCTHLERDRRPGV